MEPVLPSCVVVVNSATMSLKGLKIEQYRGLIIFTYTTLGGFLIKLELKYNGPQNPILTIKAPTLGFIAARIK